MPELILHHYWTSPFTEKVRLALGRKGLAWRSVEQPTIMPKPELLPLADDYGRDPIAGEIVRASAQEIAIRRSDPLVGEVVVHFPRAGFLVVRS